MNCHKQTVNDLDLQLEINEQEIELEKGEEVPYNESRIDNLLEHKLKLTKAKRYQAVMSLMLTGITCRLR